MEEGILESIETAANDHGESHWLVDRRLDATKRIIDLPKMLKLVTPSFKRSGRDLIKSEANSNRMLVQVGQRIIKNDLPDELDEKGVILTDIFTALREHPRLIQRYFMDKVINYDESDFTRYHLSMINSGIFLYIPKEVKIKQPIEIQIVQDSTTEVPMISHILIVAEEESEVTFKQFSKTVGDNSNLVQSFVEILARANSIVNYESIDEFSQNSQVYFKNRGFLNRKSEINWNISVKNKNKTVGEISNNLFGSDSSANIILDSQNDNNKIDLLVKKHGKNVNYTETIV